MTSALTTYLDRLTAALSTATAPEPPDAEAVLPDRGITGDVDTQGDIPDLSFLSGAQQDPLGVA
ncbi:MAG: glutaminase A, partial [Brachybacterium sp.]|nr:glutaminase A [Brachybacterium sp.]